MSPHFSNSEVKKKHLRRVPIINTPNGYILTYENEKCPNPESCPDKQRCKKCHNEKEFMYHPLVYMTAKCNNGPSCKNRSRFCAFYHTEGERVESERNREELLRKLNRQKSKRTSVPSVPPTTAPKWNTENILPNTEEDTQQKITKSESSSSTKEENPGSITSSGGASTNILSKSKEDKLPVETSQTGTQKDSFQNSPFASTDLNSSQKGASYNLQGQHSSGYNINARDGNTNGSSAFHYTNSSGFAMKPAINYAQSTRSVRINEKIRLFPQKIISQRSEGIIYEGIFVDHGIEYSVAIKEIELRFLGNDLLNHESLLKTQHRNLVRYHTVCYKNDRAYIVMDLHSQTLATFLREDYSRIQSSDNVLTPLCKSLLHQLCSVIVYLQTEQNVAHCDLLPDNIFIEMHQNNNHRIILGDMNRTRARLHNSDDTSQSKELYRYILPKDWLSPEETSYSSFTMEQMFQSDMWRLGMLIFYIVTGEPFSQENPAKFHINSQPWSSLASVLLQGDYMLRLSSSSLLQHPVFWHYLPSRVGDFYKQVCLGAAPIDISALLLTVDSSTFLYPRKNWKSVILPDNNFPYPDQSGCSVFRLLQLIVDVFTHHQLKDEYYNAVLHQCSKQRSSDPISFFQQSFPCLLFKIWELLFQEKKHLEKQRDAFSELLSC